MLERLIAWVLNNYLGKYVENLNTDQLSVALLQGAVELENLPLKKNALRQVGIPVEIKSGYIGKVKLQVPVSQFRSAPWVICIEQLYVVAGPVSMAQWDEELEEKAAQEYKIMLLDALEARWRTETESACYYSSSYSSWLSYGTSFMTNIVENLQLNITDVHIRYEDELTVPGSMFAMGIAIDSLEAQSCDDQWVPGLSKSDLLGHSFKLVQMNNLSIYWDSLDQGGNLWNNLSNAELAARIKQESKGHNYILSPVSAHAHLKKNLSEQPIRSKSQPRIFCDLHLDNVPLHVTDVSEIPASFEKIFI
uniref:Vacuolar protein sorting-associated protein 13D n=1 Tax=Cacopsylla melanoneura TaxID=428564 RepID=A0A8D8MD60_9HEMI